MFKMKFKFVSCLILLTWRCGLGQQDYYFTFSTIKARPIAMASAYTAMEDNIVSANFNPATLSFYRFDKAHRITLFFNPIAPTGLFSTNQEVDLGTKRPVSDRLKTILLAVKGIAVTANFLDLALLLNEQVINTTVLREQRQFFQDGATWDNSYHSLIARLKLADRVSLGFSSSVYRQIIGGQAHSGWGFSYGILLKPSPRMNVGLAFIDFPNKIAEVRLPLERLSDQTMNIGICYRPWSNATVSLDVRNLTEDDRKGVREIHLGFEQNLFSVVALRTGYFQERFASVRIFSAGIGLIDSNIFVSEENKFNHPQFMVNYAFLYQKEQVQFARWHVLSLLIRI
ncbi:MAG: hypothetical protein ONB33_12145 [candidate division KSB1 bacterium]|nr:hypothetical protein [candidate division KSB1 bacterium]MDZ7358340.1 hypothetical protein [candidate division KSB1 bacterium]MDZ7399141.1 hypothetical protein [candidate division KSB1 bacterium]